MTETPKTSPEGQVRGYDIDPNRRLGDEYLNRYAPMFESSPKMRAIKEMIEATARTTATILIRGESGVGKELVARAMHAASRHQASWVKVNCAALPAELLESELFGHEKGAFTGAYRRKIGKFELANNGTIFLDEVADLPLTLQPKLLHVLQDGEFSRIGGHETIRVDARVITATNSDLELAVSNGAFREDLYYRLNVVELYIPPLRDRREEIPHLAEQFLAAFNTAYHRTVELTPSMMDLLVEYSWPGNVRELENILRRLVVLGDPGHVLGELQNRLQALAQRSPAEPPAPAAMAAAPAALGLKEISRRATREAESHALRQVLEQVRWNRTKAARILRVSYKTLLTKIAECGLSEARRKDGSR